jgi:5,10-methylenetetrahydromethanopterin reductase
LSDGRELGLALQTNKRPGAYAELARLAEGAGFDVVTVYNDLWFQPALPALLEIARETGRVRVGPSCLNPFTVHPVELAGQVAALDLASGGRAFLGLAAGAWLGELGVEQRHPVTAIREAWEIVSRLLAGDRTGFSGSIFRLPAGEGLAYAAERHSVPLLIGTWSPRLTAFAAERADEVKLGGSANPDLVRLTRERLGPAASRVGIVAGAVCVIDPDGEQAREHARRQVAMYLDVVGGLDPTVNLEPELLSTLATRLRAGDEGGAARLISDGLLDRFAFAGTPRHVADLAEAVLAAGACRVDFGTPHGLNERTGVELLTGEVAPALARHLR